VSPSGIVRELLANIRVATLREAAKPLIAANHKGSVDLIVDGGSENNNAVVDGLRLEGGISIQKLVALRDVHFSNSMVEAVNKVLKYRCLLPQKIPDGATLVEIAESAIVDYNDRRPRGSLDPNRVRPFLAYSGVISDFQIYLLENRYF
jgi:putative transposase